MFVFGVLGVDIEVDMGYDDKFNWLEVYDLMFEMLGFLDLLLDFKLSKLIMFDVWLGFLGLFSIGVEVEMGELGIVIFLWVEEVGGVGLLYV